MLTSKEWHQYYQHNANCVLDIPWQLGAELTADEIADISASLREFQAGESSEGKHLYRNAQLYADRTGDRDYVSAIGLFIAEEQRHARDLGRFLKLNGIPLVQTTFTDRVFRRMRGITRSLEISIAVLITAEIIAKPHYAAIRNATNSTILRRICDQLLRDEVRHVEFQAERLAILRAGRGRFRKTITAALQRFLFLGTVLIVWLLHRRALRRGEVSFLSWWQDNWREFNSAFAAKVSEPGLCASNPREPHRPQASSPPISIAHRLKSSCAARGRNSTRRIEDSATPRIGWSRGLFHLAVGELHIE